MAEQEKTKDKFIVRSVRGPQEAFDLLKQMGDEGFENQGEALEYLVNLYNIEEGRKKTGRETEIDEFRSHFNRIMDMYLASLALCSDAEDRIREGFAVRMDNQEQEIKRLRDQCTENKNLYEAAKKEIDLKVTVMDKQEKVLEKAQAERDAAVSDHDAREKTIRNQMDMLKESQEQEKALRAEKERQAAEIANLKEQVASLTAKVENLDDYKQRLTKANDDLKVAAGHASELDKQLADAKAKMEAAARDKENAVREAEVRAAQAANSKVEQQQERYSKLQARCEELEERLRKA